MIRYAIACLLLLIGTRAPAEAPRLLPTPARMELAGGEGFALTRRVPLVAQGAGAINAARRFAGLMATQGVRLKLRSATSGPMIRFVRKAGLPPEGYRLDTGPGGATITASDNAGLFYGGVTLWQLATQGGSDRQIAPVRIEDQPRFGWRGLMLDSARHFQSAAYVRHLIDWMAANKLNRLHWHLVDDQGWRLQIRKYPRLTAVSAWRLPATAPGAPPLPRTGGFYTQAQVRAIVAYARARGITIVPEIEMPGHALAAIRAYPRLGMGVPVPDGTWSGWGVFPWLYNTDTRTFAFLEDVLSEVMQLFPSPWIHVGGDEAVKDQWHADARTQAKIAALGLKDEDALQGWFTARIGRFLQAHGRRLIGWDEILEGGVPPSATVMSWRGMEGAIAAARAGHDTVLSPAPTLYLDHIQGTGPAEPAGVGGPETLGDVLGFDPAPASLSPSEQAHVLGVQANLWTENVRTEQHAQWMTFPRASALAEIGWSPAGPRDLGEFVGRLVPQLDRMASLGLQSATSAWAVTADLDPDPLTGTPVARLAVQAPLPIHYTLDGSAPTIASPVYAGPLAVPQPARLRATAFLGTRAMAGGLDMAVDAQASRTRLSTMLASCAAGAAPRLLEDDYPAAGPRALFSVVINNPCWEWRQAPVTGARAIAISVGQLPWAFQIRADRASRFLPPNTPAGEFEVRAGCDGPRIAVLPLAPAAGNPGVTRLEAPLAAVVGRPDLCFTYTARDVNPLWAINKVELIGP